MDSRFWTVFRRAPIEIEGQRYESLQAGKAPMKGNLPVKGNGPSILELYRQGKATANQPDRFRAALDSEPAPAPAVPLTRKLSRSMSTRTAKSRRKSMIPSSAKAPEKDKTGLKKSQKSSLDLRGTTQMGAVPVLNNYNYNNFGSKPLPRVPSSIGAKKHRRKSTHVDLFDAVPTKDSLREVKISRRNYGEDVADRNISMYRAESTRTSIDNRRHNRGKSDVGVAYNTPQIPDTEWLNQPWIKEGARPWEQPRAKNSRSGSRGAKSIRSLRQEHQSDWPIETRNRSKSENGDPLSQDDADFELGAVTISDDIFYPGRTLQSIYSDTTKRQAKQRNITHQH